MENSKFVLGSKYDLRTKLILLMGANILIFLGFDWIYQSLITLFFLVIIISDGYKKTAIRYILFFGKWEDQKEEKRIVFTADG